MSGQRYTPEFKEEAVRQVVERGYSVAEVALANKTARMAWAMLRHETDYDPDYAIS